MSKIITCPNCGQKTEFCKENQARPFCSDRCKLIDLGEWAEGNYALDSDEPLSEEDVEKVVQTKEGKEEYDSH